MKHYDNFLKRKLQYKVVLIDFLLLARTKNVQSFSCLILCKMRNNQ